MAGKPTEGASTCNLTDSTTVIGYGVSVAVPGDSSTITDLSNVLKTDTVRSVPAVVVDGGAFGCLYVLDTAASSRVLAGASAPGIPNSQLCPKAEKLADAVVATLQTQQPK